MKRCQFVLQQSPEGEIVRALRPRQTRVQIREHAVFAQRGRDQRRVPERLGRGRGRGRARPRQLDVRDLALRPAARRARRCLVRHAGESETRFELGDVRRPGEGAGGSEAAEYGYCWWGGHGWSGWWERRGYESVAELVRTARVVGLECDSCYLSRLDNGLIMKRNSVRANPMLTT